MTAERSIFARMSRHARTFEVVRALDEAAKRSAMPPDQQLRFLNFMEQMSGARVRKDPLPMPPMAEVGE